MLVSVTLPTLNLPGWPGTEEETCEQSARTHLNVFIYLQVFDFCIENKPLNSFLLSDGILQEHTIICQLVLYRLFNIGKMFPLQESEFNLKLTFFFQILPSVSISYPAQGYTLSLIIKSM